MISWYIFYTQPSSYHDNTIWQQLNNIHSKITFIIVTLLKCITYLISHDGPPALFQRLVYPPHTFLITCHHFQQNRTVSVVLHIWSTSTCSNTATTQSWWPSERCWPSFCASPISCSLRLRTNFVLSSESWCMCLRSTVCEVW